MPLLVTLGGIMASAVALWACGNTAGVGVEERQMWGEVYGMALAGFMLMPAALLLWLALLTVVRLCRRQWQVWRAWLWSVLVSLVLFPCMGLVLMAGMFGSYDDFALKATLPEELSPEHHSGMAVPLDFSFFNPLSGDDMSPVALKWKNFLEKDEQIYISADEELPEQTPHLEKLLAEAPELLREYKLRALCHQALTPGGQVAPHLDALLLPDEVSLTKAPAREEDEAELAWRKPLMLKKKKLLDAALAPLAENSTREQLDAMIPPLPDKPFIVLKEGLQPGIYAMLLVVPRDYPGGSFRVSAREYVTGEELSTHELGKTVLTPTPYRELCRTAVLDKFTVYSGEWGEYYASTWDLHFTPAGKTEPETVNSQLYLMQGWSR